MLASKLALLPFSQVISRLWRGLRRGWRRTISSPGPLPTVHELHRLRQHLPTPLQGRLQIPTDHPWSTRPAPGQLFPFKKEHGFASEQDPSSVPGASSLPARASLGCGARGKAALSKANICTAQQHVGKSRGVCFPGSGGRFLWSRTRAGGVQPCPDLSPCRAAQVWNLFMLCGFAQRGF